MNKKSKYLLIILPLFGFNLKIRNSGDLFPISKTPNSSFFLPTSVNDTWGLMCLKINQFFNISSTLLLSVCAWQVTQGDGGTREAGPG